MTAAAASRCSTAALKGSLKTDGAAAGTTYLHLLLENTGDTACTLQGWPGTSLVTTAGRQIGQAASFDRSGSHDTVTLKPHADAIARIGIGIAGDYPKTKCDPAPAELVRIYPPGSKASLLVPLGHTATACSSSAVHLLVVTALHSGS